MSADMVPQVLVAELLPGEELLWHGRPHQGILFTATDLVYLPICALLLLGSLSFFVMALLAKRDGLIPLIAAIPLLALGLAAVEGRYLQERRRRRQTWYAITEIRILIVSLGRTHSTTTVHLDQLSESRLHLGRQGRGTIFFGPKPAPIDSDEGYEDARRRPRFEGIDNALDVYNLLRQHSQPGYSRAS